MSRFTKKLLPLLVVLTLTAASAVAQSSGAHFQRNKQTATVLNDGDLRVAWVEAGLGNANVDYSISADFDAQYFCRTNSGNIPNAANKELASGDAGAAPSFQPKNGKVIGSVSLNLPTPVDSPPTCGNGQSLDLQSVTWSNVVIIDLTNGIEFDFGDQTFTRTFFSLPN